MNEYCVYFEIYGKKLKTTVFMDHPDQAKLRICSKVIIHKVEKIEPEPDFFNDLMDIFGMK